jgi:putative membrane protein
MGHEVLGNGEPTAGQTCAMSDPDRIDLARDRTELAEDRTVLAHERSFASWVRTGMAAVGIGLGFHAIFQPVEPTWVVKFVASAFLLLAIFIFHSAQRRACGVLAKLEPHRVVALKPIRIRMLSWALICTTLALGAAMWLLIDG